MAHVVALAIALGTGLLGRVLSAALVLAVIESSECQDVEKEQRCPNSNGDTELCRVIPRVWHDQRTHLPAAFVVAVAN